MKEPRTLAALAALTASALALRLAGLTRFELFVDEAATWWFARLTAEGRLAEQMSLEPTPPLYYALVGLAMKLFGESDLVLRLPSAVFGALGVPIVFTLGRALFSPRVAWISAAILAIHPLHVFYSREARVYPLLLLLTTATFLALWRALETDRIRAWAIYACALVLVCYSHFYGLFLMVTAAALTLAYGRSARARLRGLVATGLALATFSPYLAATLPHLEESGAAWSIETFYSDHAEEKRLGRSLETQLIGAGYHPYLRQLDRPRTPAALRAACVLAQLLLLASGLRYAARGGRFRTLGFSVTAWLLPILVPWTINQLGRPIFHAGRHDVYAMGSLCVLLAVGFEGMMAAASPAPAGRRLRWAATGAVAALLAGGATFRLAALHRAPAASNHRAAGAWIADHAAPGDRVMAMGIRRLVTEHYARLAGSSVPFESFPASTDAHPGWSDVMTLMDDQAALHAEARDRIEHLGLSPDRGRLFVLLRPYRRAEGAMSATWLVDRHVLERLRHDSWRPIRELSSAELRIEAFRPPPADDGPVISTESP